MGRLKYSEARKVEEIKKEVRKSIFNLALRAELAKAEYNEKTNLRHRL